VKLTQSSLVGGEIWISVTGQRAVKLTQSPFPQHSFVQAVIATAATCDIFFVTAVASFSAAKDPGELASVCSRRGNR
jgi:hypothetical protein